MSETFTLYRLMILYMLDKVDFPLYKKKIIRIILLFSRHYQNYWTLI